MKLVNFYFLGLVGIVGGAGLLAGCEQTNATDNGAAEQVNLVFSFTGAAISVYRPNEAKLYVYELREDRAIKNCTACRFQKTVRRRNPLSADHHIAHHEA